MPVETSRCRRYFGAMLENVERPPRRLAVLESPATFAVLAEVLGRVRAELKVETFWSRLILVLSALAAVAVVELLRVWGFAIADLAFAVYGAALGLVPPIIFTEWISSVAVKSPFAGCHRKTPWSVSPQMSLPPAMM